MGIDERIKKIYRYLLEIEKYNFCSEYGHNVFEHLAGIKRITEYKIKEAKFQWIYY